MRTIWQAIRHLAPESPAGRDSNSSDGASEPMLAGYDEERCLKKKKKSSRHCRALRLKKVTLWLLLIDVAIITFLFWAVYPLIVLLTRNKELFGPRVVLTGNDTQDALKQAGQNKIPRILHQTTATDEIPEKWVDSQRSCKETYSQFEYKLWTDESARNFLATEYPWFLETWDAYDFPIQRADSIRYFVLHHYGGLYLDMDTICHQTFPLDQIESDDGEHRALFESTLPTGVTNDFMISTARHPAFAEAIHKLPLFYGFTQPWARLEPYAAIMLSSGPLFVSLVMKDYMLAQEAALPSSTVLVIHSSLLHPYITDLESSSWHRKDTQVLMWLGERPWSWFGLGAVGVVIGAYLVNYVLLVCFRAVRKVPALSYGSKLAKLT